MAALDDFDFISVVHDRSHITPFDGRLSQAGQGIQTSKGARRSLNARRFRGDCATNVRENFRFKLHYSFFRAENFAFPFLERRRSESLGVRERLPALVIVGHAGRICL